MRLVAPAACIAAATFACAPAPPSPPDACAAAWADSAAAEFVAELEAVTASDDPVWPGYSPADAEIVLHAGDAASGEACLGVWRGGRAVAYGALSEPPTLSTALYGYYLPESYDEAQRDRVPPGTQPPSVRAWLEGAGVDRATIMPVTVEDFPLPLPALVKAQVAIHEGFHVEVQSPHWAGGADNWPAWDRQPDRARIEACYGGTEAVAAAFAEERASLTRTVEALLDDDPATACEASRAFLAQRADRHALLSDVTVVRHDSTPGTCREAEAIMEMEEGVADYASWTLMYHLGRATREQLMGRYTARQDDIYYLMGAMQLHAIRGMDPAGMLDRLRRVAESASPDAGSITLMFEDAVDGYCGG